MFEWVLTLRPVSPVQSPTTGDRPQKFSMSSSLALFCLRGVCLLTHVDVVADSAVLWARLVEAPTLPVPRVLYGNLNGRSRPIE